MTDPHEHGTIGLLVYSTLDSQGNPLRQEDETIHESRMQMLLAFHSHPDACLLAVPLGQAFEYTIDKLT